MLATFIGIIPGSFVYVNLGQTLGRIDSLSGLVSTETVMALLLLGLFALVPVFARKWRSRAGRRGLIGAIDLADRYNSRLPTRSRIPVPHARHVAAPQGD